jgi:hypothetical protein
VLKEEKVYSGSAETFGKQWVVGDVVGVCLDLIDRTISKLQLQLSERNIIIIQCINLYFHWPIIIRIKIYIGLKHD